MTETSSFLPPWKHVDSRSCMQAAAARRLRRADKWQQARRRYWHPLFNTTQRYLQLQWRLSLHNVIWKQGTAFIKISISGVSQTGQQVLWIIGCNFLKIISAVYVAVIDLFMKTAIVLKSVRGSQTAERLQVEVIVLWMQWNQSPRPCAPPKKSNPPSKQNHCSKLAKLIELPQCCMLKTASFSLLLHYCYILFTALVGLKEDGYL